MLIATCFCCSYFGCLSCDSGRGRLAVAVAIVLVVTAAAAFAASICAFKAGIIIALGVLEQSK